jgi:hypothetical protein
MTSIRLVLLLIVSLLMNVPSALSKQQDVKMEYGKPVTFKKNEAIKFKDFTLIYRGIRIQNVPKGIPLSNRIEQFEVVSPSGKSKFVEWSSGMGEIAPTFFRVDSKKFAIDLRSSPAVEDGKFNVMKDDQLVIRIL